MISGVVNASVGFVPLTGVEPHMFKDHVFTRVVIQHASARIMRLFFRFCASCNGSGIPCLLFHGVTGRKTSPIRIGTTRTVLC